MLPPAAAVVVRNPKKILLWLLFQLSPQSIKRLTTLNGLKTTIIARENPTAFSELRALFSDHDYMLVKTRAPTPSITSSFDVYYAMGSPSMPEACQAQLSELTAQLSALGFQVSPIAPSSPQAFDGDCPSNNNWSNNNNRGNRNNSSGNNNNRGRDNGHQFDWASTQNTWHL
ncbi:hypothetical protein Tco_1450057 [Tanacetum coccineum]